MKSERRKAGFIKMLLLVMTLAVFYAGKCKCGTKNKSVGKQRRISLLLQSEGQKSKE